MKKLVVSVLFIETLLLVAQPMLAQVDIKYDSLSICSDGAEYAPIIFHHFTTDVEGLRLRESPSLTAPVKTVLPKNTRLISRGECTGEPFSVTFNDGVPRIGSWCAVSVWKGQGLDGWVFSGALTLSYALIDAKFGGGLDALNEHYFVFRPIDSSQFTYRLTQTEKKLTKPGGALLISPDGQYGIRQLTAKDHMTGLEFVIFQKDGSQRKITVEDLCGGYSKAIAWAKEPGSILIKWWNKIDGNLYYDCEMPLPVRPY